MWIKRNVVMLPTNEKAILFLTQNKLYYSPENQEVPKNSAKNQHLYILSDEEIKEGDWFMTRDGFFKAQKNNQYWGDKKFCNIQYWHKKIIATTDESITIEEVVDGGNWSKLHIGRPVRQQRFLPQPSQQFVEKYIKEYNKGNIITEVMVEYIELGGIVFTPDKPFVLKINPKDNTINICKTKDSWNREEVEEIYRTARNKAYEETKAGFDLVDIVEASDKWIEENL